MRCFSKSTFSSWAQLFRKKKKINLVLYMLQSWERVQEAKSLHQIWQSYWSLLIKTGKGKGNQSLGNSIHSFNPLSRYFIFKTQVQPSAKLRDCVGPWGVLNFWALFTPTRPYLPIVPQPFLLSECIFLTILFLYSLETNKKEKRLTCWH